MRISRIVTVLIMIYGLCIISLYAQEQEVVQPQVELSEIVQEVKPDEAIVDLEAEGSREEESEGGETISLDFKDADIKSVLKVIAFKSGVNIVSTPEVRGTVTIKLQEVPWEQALETIVRTYGFAYEWISNRVIMISTLEKLAEQRRIQAEASLREPLDTQTFVMNFTRAEEVKKAVEKLVSAERGKITVEPRTNTLIITDTKSNLIKIGKIVKRLDKITPQVTIEAKIIETTLGNADRLGIDWTMKVTTKGAKRPTIFPFTRWEGARDYYPIPDYTSAYDDDTSLWTITSSFPFSGEGFFFPNVDKYLGSMPMGKAAYTDGVLKGDYSFGTLDFSQLQAVLEILKSRSNTKIVSNPRITTLDNKQAKIIVGTIIPIPIYSYSKESGTRVISGYKDQEVGIKLVVTPNINERDFITLQVKPSVDEIIDYTGPDDERPIISTRNAETKVMIKDGETLVIGGLISENKYISETKVPLLGDIPILKFFFSKKVETLTKTELIIFITPHIVREEI